MRKENALKEDLTAILTKAKFENIESYKDLIIPIATEAEVLSSEEYKIEAQDTPQRIPKGKRQTFVIGLNIERIGIK